MHFRISCIAEITPGTHPSSDFSLTSFKLKIKNDGFLEFILTQAELRHHWDHDQSCAAFTCPNCGGGFSFGQNYRIMKSENFWKPVPENFRHWNGNEENGNKKRASRMTKIKGNTDLKISMLKIIPVFMKKWPEISKLSVLKLNCHFCGKTAKIMIRMNSRILTNSPYIWFFEIFQVNTHHHNGHLLKISEINI